MYFGGRYCCSCTLGHGCVGPKPDQLSEFLSSMLRSCECGLPCREASASIMGFLLCSTCRTNAKTNAVIGGHVRARKQSLLHVTLVDKFSRQRCCCKNWR